MKKEIELRVKFKNPAKFGVWMRENAELIGEQEQIDWYLEPCSSPYVYEGKNGKLQADKWLRVRVENNINASVCLKSVVRGDDEEYLYSNEYELKVDDGDSALKLFEGLNYKKVIEINKKRKDWKYKDLIISEDFIEGLGGFVELELYKGDLGYNEGIRYIENFLQEVLSMDYEIVKGGYPQLVWDKIK
ncbi:CYTH domain-containing protein [Pseudoalteromonas sp. JC3]|uniref:CYTH domain-containing protein n=1 Tax=Pseudoalteromonas sp. JC3 TaxID=2810196 RepID=UPI0019D1BC8A|nr:CYTH domain-containing protein [Pseudoalteromonas sp. JC3]MBR8842412.1 CYTH domain-containing protein [Pseudoalteromonas sp. JC3]WJE09469.1 CYTH domain-containing protein [Pseudoalteromonas sp. JC3]